MQGAGSLASRSWKNHFEKIPRADFGGLTCATVEARRNVTTEIHCSVVASFSIHNRLMWWMGSVHNSESPFCLIVCCEELQRFPS